VDVMQRRLAFRLVIWLGWAMVGPTAGVGATDAVTGTVPAPDGVAIAYTVRGEGATTLVFVHGWCCDQTYWDHQVRHFCPRCRVVTLDLAGHGRSGQERSVYTMAAFAQDVAAVVTGLELRQVVLVGHSLGGLVIVEAARLMPDRIIGLVPADSLQNVERRVAPEQAAIYLRPLETDFAQSAQAFVRQNMFLPASDSALVDRIAADMAQGPPEVGRAVLREVFLYSVLPALAAVRVPLRCINSDRYPTDVAAARRHLPTFDAVLTPGVGHFNMIEDPVAFNRLLENFLGELPAGGTGGDR